MVLVTPLRSLVLLVLLALAGAHGLGAQISPGPLARAHQSVEGNSNCTKCHGGGNEGMAARCLSCHKEMGWLVARGRGLHGRPGVKGEACASCHPDHAGREFAMVTWKAGSEDRFDHRETGWALKQTHATTKCADCHTAKFQVSPARTLAPAGRPTKWTGLEAGCTGCHEDVHRGALGTDCSKCHDLGKWEVTPGFSHDSTRYPLTGKHVSTECDKCHTAARLHPARDAAGQLVPVYKPVSSESCADCHRDVHAGRLGPDCAKCHQTSSFRTIDRNNFDHEKTSYPLRGKHATVRCADCHGTFATAVQKKPAFKRCGDCHADQHGGTATLAGKPADCDACHALQGFTPATFRVQDHAATRYPLEGKHAAVPCAKCHGKDATAGAATRLGPSRVVIRPAFATCQGCHADVHGGQLARTPGAGACADCHKVNGWTPSTVDAAAHAKAGFPLEGEHATATCRSCHGVERTGLPPLAATPAMGTAKFRFALAEKECASCHVDPHAGRFAAGGARAKATGCAACHDARRFRPSTAGITQHADYGFPLDGAHGATPCVACHKELGAPGPRPASSLVKAGGRFPALAFEAKRDCAACHENVHGTQFADLRDGGRCESCHGTERFVPASKFDHDRTTSFPLRGGHEGVACNRCHPTDLASRVPGRLIWRPVSGKCESCHKEVKP